LSYLEVAGAPQLLSDLAAGKGDRLTLEPVDLAYDVVGVGPDAATDVFPAIVFLAY
jgi:hypothetical protein